MAENDPNLPQPPKKSDADPTDEREIDRVLAEAAGLTKELEDEIGTEPVLPQPGVDLDPVTADPEKADVDSQLNAVEELLKGVNSAAQEQGPTPPSEITTQADQQTQEDERRPAEPPPRDRPKPTADLDEETGVADGPDADSLDDASSMERENIPETSGEFAASEESKTGDGSMVAESIGLPADGPRPLEVAGTIGQPNSGSPPPTVAANTSPGHPVESDKPRMRSRLSDGLARCREVALGLFEEMLGVLDLIDGIFAWISYDTRRIIGWIALALLVAACSITLYSLS